MWAVSEMLLSATEAIFILVWPSFSALFEKGWSLDQDWWLTPELYLRRPAAKYPEYRLDRILKRKAEEGVMIHVIVYKEASVTSVIGP